MKKLIRPRRYATRSRSARLRSTSENRGSSVSIPATVTKKAARVIRPFDSGIGGPGRGSVWANARGAKASRNAGTSSRPFMSSATERSRIITVPVVEAVLRRRESADDAPAGYSRRRHPQGLRQDDRRRWRLVRRAGGGDLRVDRPERRREDHDHGVRRRAAQTGWRGDFSAGLSSGTARVPAAGTDWRPAAGGAVAEA